MVFFSENESVNTSGDTFNDLECDFRSRPTIHHLVYTALSRVRKLENLFIVDEFLSRKISVHPEVSSIVVDPASVFELLYSQLLLSLSCLVILNPLAQYTLFSLQVTLEMDRLRQEAVFPTLQSLSKCCKIRLLFQNVQSLKIFALLPSNHFSTLQLSTFSVKLG